MRIIFMGTPDFAAESLKALINEGHEICGVFTQPDKPRGRKQILSCSAVKEVAINNNIKIFQPLSLKSQEIIDIIKVISPDVIVVVAYGKILPKNMLQIPKFGSINVHGSLLPKYRGAAPIQWSVINGEKETGITTMFMNEGLDTGDIILTESTKIFDDETSGGLYKRLSKMGAKLIVDTLKKLKDKKIIAIKQGQGESYAPPLEKAMGKIDFTKKSYEIHNLIRGLNPWPIAYTKFNGKLIKIYKSKLMESKPGKPGEVLSIFPFIVGCGDNTAIEIIDLQIEGKNKMPSEIFMRGSKIRIGDILGE